MVGCLGRLDELQTPLDPAETPGVERMAPVRLREYVAGRTAARRALLALTGAGAAVPRNPDRSPAWPAGVGGSLSHSRRYAVAVAARTDRWRSVGVDLEEASRLGRELWPEVMTAEDLVLLEGMAGPEAVRAATLRFCAREACFKCLEGAWPGCCAGLAPQAFRVRVAGEGASFSVVVPVVEGGPEVRGSYAAFDGHWLVLCGLPAGDAWPAARQGRDGLIC